MAAELRIVKTTKSKNCNLSRVYIITKIRINSVLLITFNTAHWFMEIAKIIFKSPLYTEITHLNSETITITDAPKDNNGEGKALSPTDMLATSLASCAMTIIGIQCMKRNISIKSMETSVSKKMASNPRRVEEVWVKIKLSTDQIDSKTQEKIIKYAKNCPVALSLSKELNQKIKIEWI